MLFSSYIVTLAFFSLIIQKSFLKTCNTLYIAIDIVSSNHITPLYSVEMRETLLESCPHAAVTVTRKSFRFSLNMDLLERLLEIIRDELEFKRRVVLVFKFFSDKKLKCPSSKKLCRREE